MSHRKSSSKSCSKSKKCEPCGRLRLDVRHTLQQSFRDDQGFYHYVVQVVLKNNSDSDIKRLSLQENLLVGGSVVINGPIKVKGDEHVVPRGVNTPNEEWLTTGELLKCGSKLKACRSATVVYELLYISLHNSGSLSSSIDVSGVVGCDRPQSIHSDLDLIPSPTSVSPRVLSESVCVNWRGQDIGDNTLVKEVSIDGVLYEVAIVDWVAREGFPRQYIAGNLVIPTNLRVVSGLARGPGGEAPIVIDPRGGMFTSPLSLSFSPDDEQAFRGIEFCFEPVWSFSDPGLFAGLGAGAPLVNSVGGPSIVTSDGTVPGSKSPQTATGTTPSGEPWVIGVPQITGADFVYDAAQIGGNLAFLYSQPGELWYARQDPAAPSGWATSLVTPAAFWSSLIEFDGLPTIAFDSAGGISYARLSSVNGGPAQIVTIAAGVRAGLGQIKIAAVAGLPVVAYVNRQDNRLYYAYPSDASGISWTNVRVASDVALSATNALGLIDAGGVPAVAYLSSDRETLYYGRASDFKGSSWSQNVVVQFPGVQIRSFSLKLINGLPAVALSYTTAIRVVLFYYTSNGVTGTSWQATQVAASQDTLDFRGVFLEEIAGNAGIAYTVGADNFVRYAYRINE